MQSAQMERCGTTYHPVLSFASESQGGLVASSEYTHSPQTTPKNMKYCHVGLAKCLGVSATVYFGWKVVMGKMAVHSSESPMSVAHLTVTHKARASITTTNHGTHRNRPSQLICVLNHSPLLFNTKSKHCNITNKRGRLPSGPSSSYDVKRSKVEVSDVIDITSTVVDVTSSLGPIALCNPSNKCHKPLWSIQPILTGYKLLESIGTGSTASVRRAVEMNTMKQVAVKIVNRYKAGSIEDHAENVYRETRLLSILDHPNIVQFHCAIETTTKVYNVQEYVQGIDLERYIAMHGRLPLNQLFRLFSQLVSALKHCHARGVVHRDIKSQNIMIDIEGNLKLIDFGLAGRHNEGQWLETFCGTPAFAAPEMILGEKYRGPETDAWSAGVVFFHMITGKLPFMSVLDILNGSYAKEDLGEFSDIIKGLLCVNTAKRMIFSEVETKLNELFYKD
ncbi:map/microtubule affinity-regulating kinase 2,4 [Planoprotostelium fungivorum]|uniref:non-specific serine/threonine protein kinase n=1 Tax=Planoprotostelium fungivorum TaxID=1890364 RepID=A0A2P6N729_9EUKA|nr:map/microtubule affinity-regulating kinase 2,4 [Planoprotostelium fungivorum]